MVIPIFKGHANPTNRFIDKRFRKPLLFGSDGEMHVRTNNIIVAYFSHTSVGPIRIENNMLPYTAANMPSTYQHDTTSQIASSKSGFE